MAQQEALGPCLWISLDSLSLTLNLILVIGVIRGKLRPDHVRIGLEQGWGSILDCACLAHMKPRV